MNVLLSKSQSSGQTEVQHIPAGRWLHVTHNRTLCLTYSEDMSKLRSSDHFLELPAILG